MSEKHKCSETVYASWGNGHGTFVPCKKSGKHNENGQWYCGIHAPSIVKVKREARSKKWKEEWAASKVAEAKAKAEAAELQRRAAMFPALVATLETVAGWLESFSMPPTSTIEEKQHHLALIEAVLAKATQEQQ